MPLYTLATHHVQIMDSFVREQDEAALSDVRCAKGAVLEALLSRSGGGAPCLHTFQLPGRHPPASNAQPL